MSERAYLIQGQQYESFTCNRCSIFRVLALRRYGGIAQLGEHLLCKQGVIGSIPIISTKKPQTVVCGFFCYGEDVMERH